MINASAESENEISTQLAIAKARGYFDYHHFKVAIPENVHFSVSSTDFDFTSFAPCPVVSNIIAHELPSTCKTINTHLFDYLLIDKHIHDGQYDNLPGWLATYESLQLYITSDLSMSQWYCLLNLAKQ